MSGDEMNKMWEAFENFQMALGIDAEQILWELEQEVE